MRAADRLGRTTKAGTKGQLEKRPRVGRLEMASRRVARAAINIAYPINHYCRKILKKQIGMVRDRALIGYGQSDI